MIKIKVLCGFEDIAKCAVLTLGYLPRNDNAECYVNFKCREFIMGVLHIIQLPARNYAFRNFINF